MNILQETPMWVVLGKFELLFPVHLESHQQERALQEIVQSVFEKFKVSLYQLQTKQKWQRVQFGFSVVGDHPDQLNDLFHQVLHDIRQLSVADLVESHTEMVNF